MSAMIPIISPRMQRFGTAGQLPTLTGPRLFSPLSTNANCKCDSKRILSS